MPRAQDEMNTETEKRITKAKRIALMVYWGFELKIKIRVKMGSDYLYILRLISKHYTKILFILNKNAKIESIFAF
jgi:hypothetical protein